MVLTNFARIFYVCELVHNIIGLVNIICVGAYQFRLLAHMLKYDRSCFVLDAIQRLVATLGPRGM